MSSNYADGLSNYENKGVLGLNEEFDSEECVEEKAALLSEWILQSRHVVVHTGAGISTAAGIPDFRGPNGVWTLEKKGLKPNINVSFDDALPTITHMALKELVAKDYVKFIVTQNIDGLHLRSGLNRKSVAELHGNMFTQKCDRCHKQLIRSTATTSVGQKCLKLPCRTPKNSGLPCRGTLYDTILDWEASLPAEDLDLAYYHSNLADLNICLGTTLQIVPSGNLPLHSRKYGGRLVIINLQPTKHDSKADLIIHTYVDNLMVILMKKLGLKIPEYLEDEDPINDMDPIEWTLNTRLVKTYEKLYDEMKKNKKKRKLNSIKAENEEIKIKIKKEEL